MPLLILFFVVAIGAVLLGAYLTFRRLRRHGLLVALTASAAVASSLLLLWPIPIHGGFTFFGEVVLHEWQSSRRLHAAAAALAKRDAHRDHLTARFRGELPITSSVTIDADWAQVATADGSRGWHDLRSGLVWSDWLALPTGAGLPDLATARRPCADLPPAGYWALANEAEHVVLARHRPPAAVPPAPGSVVSYVAEAASTLELPTYRLNQSGAPDSARTYFVHCVARTAGSPARGYVREDIPLAEWNAYQLGKLTR